MLEEEEDDNNHYMFSHIPSLKSLLYQTPNSPTTPTCLSSMVAIKDKDTCFSTTSSTTSNNNNSHRDNDISIFPPINHENLVPNSPFDDHDSIDLHLIDHHPTPSPPPFSPPLPSPPSDLDAPLSSPAVIQVPRWWVFALQVLRSKIASIRSYFERIGTNSNNDGNGRVFWTFANVGLAVTVVVWWLCVRVKRRWQKRESVGKLLQTIRERDEKIIQLLNQIAQMNEVLLARHKVMASKLVDG